MTRCPLPSLEPVDQLAQRIYFAAKIGIDAFAFASQIKVGDYIVAAAPEVRLSGEHILKALFLAHYGLRFLRVRPQIWVGRLFFYFG